MALDEMEEKDLFVSALREYKPVLLHDAEKNQEKLTKGTREIVKETGMSSIAVAPIVHKREFLGLIAVGNLSSGQPLTQSDVNLLSGIASEAALGMVNALSFQKLKDSEKKYRELVENANSIILRRDPAGRSLSSMSTHRNSLVCRKKKSWEKHDRDHRPRERQSWK